MYRKPLEGPLLGSTRGSIRVCGILVREDLTGCVGGSLSHRAAAMESNNGGVERAKKATEIYRRSGRNYTNENKKNP